ncbi:MAG: DUF1963 domain-containing protein [Phycisphaerae bacterium]|nr:DUF1963 domain-containing protein [Phycisphaerae bacterium]
MPEYEYTAITMEGKDVAGKIDAADVGDAISQLRQKKLCPLKVKLVYGMEPTREQKVEYMKRAGRFAQQGRNPFMVFIDRIRGKMRLRAFDKQQEKERRKLLPRKDEIISNTFAILDANLRKASIAQIGGFRPPDDSLCSWFGDVFVCKEGEEWPQWDRVVGKKGVYLTPLGQFNLTEAPYVPEKLKQFKMITVFIDDDYLPFDKAHGHGWIVRAYKSLEDLVPLEKPDVDFEIKPFPMKWELVENEGPSWEDAWGITDLTEYNLVADSEFYDRYQNSEKTKLGGYPALIQGELRFGINDFVFQIGTEEKAGWYWGDCGIGYFGLNDIGEWLFEWTCY